MAASLPDDGFAEKVAALQDTLRARGVTTEGEVAHESGATESREYPDQYGVAYATETRTWTVAWALKRDGESWWLEEREWLDSQAVHTAGTSGGGRYLVGRCPLGEAPQARRQSIVAALPKLAKSLGVSA